MEVTDASWGRGGLAGTSEGDRAGRPTSGDITWKVMAILARRGRG